MASPLQEPLRERCPERSLQVRRKGCPGSPPDRESLPPEDRGLRRVNPPQGHPPAVNRRRCPTLVMPPPLRGAKLRPATNPGRLPAIPGCRVRELEREMHSPGMGWVAPEKPDRVKQDRGENSPDRENRVAEAMVQGASPVRRVAPEASLNRDREPPVSPVEPRPGLPNPVRKGAVREAQPGENSGLVMPGAAIARSHPMLRISMRSVGQPIWHSNACRISSSVVKHRRS